MQQILVNFFCRVHQGDVAILESITAFQRNIFIEQDSQNLVFSLPALHLYLINELQLEYREFRKMIYQSSINSQLARAGAKIQVYTRNSNVDENLYILVKA